MARLSQLFAPKEREFFDLFEEAAANIVRARALDVRGMHAEFLDRYEGRVREYLARLSV